MRVEESIEIRCSPDEVWTFVEDHNNDLRWCRKVKSVDRLGADRWKVMHKPVPLRPAVPLFLERLTAEPPTRLTMREDDNVSVFNVEYRLDAVSSGTRFTQVSDFERKKLPRLLQRIFARGVRRDIQGQLRGLKRALEG